MHRRASAIAWDMQFRYSVRSLAVAGYSLNVACIAPNPSMPGMVVVLQWLRARLIAPGTALHKLDFSLKNLLFNCEGLLCSNPFMNILEGCYFLLSIEAALCTIRAAQGQRSLDRLHKTKKQV